MPSSPGRLSVALNAISIPRVAELRNLPIADDIWLASMPRGPVMRMGNEHVMLVYGIWRFAKNKEAAKKFLVDQQLGYRQHFMRSSFYNFPAWTSAIKGGFKTIRKLAAQDTHKPRREVHDPDDDCREVHDEPRAPRVLERGDRRDLEPVACPPDVRRGGAREAHAGGRGQQIGERVADDLPEVAGPGARLVRHLFASRAPVTGPRLS